LKHLSTTWTVQDFFPYGYDERQYCSPGFDLPVGCLMRSPHGSFPEYHTSADNLDLVRPQHLYESLNCYRQVVTALEQNRTLVNQSPKCEPQLGKRGLYAAIGGDSQAARKQLAMLWVLNLADGSRTLLEIAERADIPFAEVEQVARLLEQHGLLRTSDGHA
jgi:aminopeptidase-like protein